MDFDFFDDLLTNPAPKPGGARAGSKFQPKAKPKARPPHPRKEPPPPSTQSPQIVTVPDSSNQFYGSTEKDNVPQSPPPPPLTDNWHSSFHKSQEEAESGDVYIGLESLDDGFLPQTTTSTSTVTEAPAIHTSDDQNVEEELIAPDLCNPVDACPNSEGPAQTSILVGEEGAIFNNDGDLHIESRTENAETFPCLDTLDVMSESTGGSGRRSGKFQPKPKLRKQSAMAPNQDEIESVLYAKDTGSILLDTENMVEGSSPSFQADDLIDFSCIGLSDSAATDPVSDFQVDEDPTHFTETSPTEHTEAGPEMPRERAKRGRRKLPTEPGSALDHQKASTSYPEDQTGGYSGRLRKRTNRYELLDQSEDEGHDDDFALEHEDDTIDTEYVVENESLNETPPSTAKKPPVEKEKPVRKRKKANGESVEEIKAPKKKFSHSTRRNRRRVNPELLKTPEDEIDFQNLPLKTRIRLAEHKERMVKNGSKRPENSLTNESATGFSGYHDEDVGSEGRDSGDEYKHSVVPGTSNGLNYHTYMKITPRARWSKQDTELFYEVLQQFGTDLAMIAECFPGRTRQQIKLKYKNEERRNPSRLHDALATRANGSSHFEVVIERLKQIADQEQDNNRDDPINLTGEDLEEDVVNTNEAAKSELSVEEEVQDMEPEDVPVVESSLKSDESEDDFAWSQYRSEI